MSSEAVQTLLFISAPENWKIWGEIMCFALWCGNFPHPIWPPSPRIVSFKEPLLPVCKESLKRVVAKIAKAFHCLCFKQCTKAGLSSLWRRHIVWALCADRSVEDEEKKAKQCEAEWAVVGLLRGPEKSHMHSHNSLKWRNWQKGTFYILVFTSPPARKAIIAAYVIACFIWNNVYKIGFITWSQRPAEHCIKSNGVAQHDSLFIQ